MLSEPVRITEQNWPEDAEIMVSISSNVYNHAKYIRDAIEGFLMQKTTFRVEIVFHDDASTDGTSEILRAYQKQYPQLIKVFIQRENTYYRPDKDDLRKSFRMSRKGKYIAHCEGDDYWIDPLKLEKQVRFMEANPQYSMCFHKAKIVVQPGHEVKLKIYNHLEEREYTGRQILQQWTIPTASVLYRARFAEYIIEANRHPDYIFQDIIMFLNLAECGKLYCLGDMMSVYRIHDESITNKPDPLKNISYIKHLQAIMNSYGGIYAHAADHLVADRYLTIMAEDIRSARWADAFIHLLYSLKYKPGVFLARVFRFTTKKFYRLPR
jgi:glycosyltransferase involved in cell wall biosynthesis